ncbi:uncharacterized protein LOC117571140 [Drosophila albomicans]|uniref:Phosphatidylinositol-glycan biosynthesis class W protein n=1 Tax=Drosophila albomicans TaxID=7291 RepID=A0A6P8XAC5_DROAB|nr:uncharacterized protein LOC117571140 [Drosophila albomicans]
MASEPLTLLDLDTTQPRYYDKRVLESIDRGFTSLLVILTTFAGIVIARVATHRLCTRYSPTICYLAEFPLIVLPGILFVTVASGYSAVFVGIVTVAFLGLIVVTGSLSRARCRAHFDLGKRPMVLTIVRALTQLITAICILAIDFESFHRPYRKSRLFGAQLMDTGIGLFVVTMGLVSRRPRNCADLKRSLLHSALPLILLGFARTLALELIGYGQDEREYGKHLNAFFTLGFTKFLGSLLCFVPRNDFQLLPLAFALLVTHQLGLSFGGIMDYVIDDDLERNSFLSANREGLLSLPGFVCIYMLSIYLSRWLVAKSLLSYAEMVRKLRYFGAFALFCWLLMVLGANAVGISRVTCNMGYVFWMIAITSTMVWLTMFIFDFIISTVMPLDTSIALVESLEKGSSNVRTASPDKSSGVFLICESLNMNGLTFFLLANVLTGGVNIFLSPEDRSDFTSIIILLLYMLLATFVVFQLYMRRIRIA